jgi:hypothetical protein
MPVGQLDTASPNVRLLPIRTVDARDEVQITAIAPGVVRALAPSVFTIAPAGQTAQPRRFFLTQVYVKTAEGWKLSTLLPFPAP